MPVGDRLSVGRWSSQQCVQCSNHLPDPSTTRRCARVTPQDVHYDGMRKDPQLRDVVGSDAGIASGGEFEGSCGISGRCEDVLDLSSFRKGVEERRTGRVGGGACSVARRSLSCIAGLLSRPVCRPGAVTERLGPLASIRERCRNVDRVSWAPIVRAYTFEDRQCRPRARHRVAGDLPEFGPAEFDRRGVIRQGGILLYRGRSLNQAQIGRRREGCGPVADVNVKTDNALHQYHLNPRAGLMGSRDTHLNIDQVEIDPAPSHIPRDHHLRQDCAVLGHQPLPHPPCGVPCLRGTSSSAISQASITLAQGSVAGRVVATYSLRGGGNEDANACCTTRRWTLCRSARSRIDRTSVRRSRRIASNSSTREPT